ncbi:thiamine pyrophosphate-binding protein [Govanella unica]|uniref:Thiamine pyrophosphate-binding protein n=1 Tax=Govanella unica TaxID=2975056 RepID=A0A9X3TWV9_9PROT|nr:thiamine pyrophosphate-binding protein [Govania unica]MDA5193182.1 thiamine pyrophosphate-binding protein [Govania unica]
MDNRRSGGQILVSAILDQDVATVFCVPGESYLPVLDALYDVQDRIRVITCRQEGGAAVMAEAHGKLTGRPGVCFVTRGPGATNAAIGVHTARQDSTPMVLFIGQVARGDRDREAFQEVDYRAMFGPLAKWVAEIDDARRIPEYVSRAWGLAMSGRPGPVVLVLPEDMLTDRVTVQSVPRVGRLAGAPAAGDMMALRRHLTQAQRPLMILGGSGWSDGACHDIRNFAEQNGLPVAASFRRQDLFDNDHAQYVGDIGLGINPALAERVAAADLLLVIGARMSENMTQGYSLPVPPLPTQKLIHVHPAVEELGKVYVPTLAIHACLAEFAAEAAALEPLAQVPFTKWTADARRDFESWTQPGPAQGDVNMGEIMQHLRDLLPDDAIICNGAGNYTIWLHRFYRYRRRHTQLAPTSGAMGYGVPSAVGAKATYPDRVVVSFSGDGCFMMNGQELATAVQYGLNVIFIIVNNGMYGTIRMHQERTFPERVMATDLVNPDFVALAKAYGAEGLLVEKTADFAAAFAHARAVGKPSVIEIRLDPEDITPRHSLSALRAAAIQ